MKKLFAALFGMMACLSVVAHLLQAPPDHKLVLVSDDNPRRKEQIALFEAEQKAGLLDPPDGPTHPPHDGLKLDPSVGGSMEKVIVQSLGGVGPDLFDCYGATALAAFVRAGVALDVTDALKARGLTPDALWPGVRPTCVREGRLYGWPTNAAVDAIWLNKDAFAQAGIPLPAKRPWTWGEFIALAKKLTVRDANGRVVRYGFLSDWGNLWGACVAQWGGHTFSPDGTRCVLDSPEAIAGTQFAHDLIYKSGVMPTPVEEASLSSGGGWGQGTIRWFGAGKGAMALGGRWWLCNLRDQTHPLRDGKPLPPTLRLSAVECPHGPYRVFRGYGRATLINAASPRAKEALDFLIYMSRKPYNDLVNAEGDAVGPVKADCYAPEFLHNPAYPEEDYNDVWRDAMEAAKPEETSPFIDGQAVNLILGVQLDLIRTDRKPVPDALRDAARKINAEIQKTLAVDPSLRRRYDALLRK